MINISQPQDDSVRKRRMLAQSLLQQGQTALSAPQQTLGHGLAAALANGFGTYNQKKATELEQQQRQQLAQAVAGGDKAEISNMLLGSENPQMQAIGLQQAMASNAPDYDLPQGWRFNQETGQAELIPGLDPSFARKNTGTSINVGLGLGETAYQKEINKQFAQGEVGLFKEIEEGYNTSQQMKPMINRLNEINTETQTGVGSDGRIFAGRFMQAIGIDPTKAGLGDTSSLEEFQAKVLQLAIPQVKKLGVNPTDKDFQIIMDSLPNLGKSPEANRRLINSVSRLIEKSEKRYGVALDFKDSRDLRGLNRALYQLEQPQEPQEPQGQQAAALNESDPFAGLGEDTFVIKAREEGYSEEQIRQKLNIR